MERACQLIAHTQDDAGPETSSAERRARLDGLGMVMGRAYLGNFQRPGVLVLRSRSNLNGGAGGDWWGAKALTGADKNLAGQPLAPAPARPAQNTPINHPQHADGTSES